MDKRKKMSGKLFYVFFIVLVLMTSTINSGNAAKKGDTEENNDAVVQDEAHGNSKLAKVKNSFNCIKRKCMSCYKIKENCAKAQYEEHKNVTEENLYTSTAEVEKPKWTENEENLDDNDAKAEARELTQDEENLDAESKRRKLTEGLNDVSKNILQKTICPYLNAKDTYELSLVNQKTREALELIVEQKLEEEAPARIITQFTPSDYGYNNFNGIPLANYFNLRNFELFNEKYDFKFTIPDYNVTNHLFFFEFIVKFGGNRSEGLGSSNFHAEIAPYLTETFLKSTLKTKNQNGVFHVETVKLCNHGPIEVSVFGNPKQILFNCPGLQNPIPVTGITTWHLSSTRETTQEIWKSLTLIPRHNN